MASEQTHQGTKASSSTAANSGPDKASRRRVLLLVGGVFGGVLVFFTALTLLSSTRWLDFAPAAGSISAAPERVAQVAELPGDGKRFSRMALSPDGTLLATVADGRPGVALRSASDGKLRTMIDADQDVIACVFSPDSQTLVTSTTDSRIQVWNVVDGQQLYGALHVFQQPPVALRITNDGQRLVAVSQDGAIGNWQINDGRQLRVSQGKLPVTLSIATFSEDGSVFAYANPTNGITIFSLDKEEVRNEIDNPAAHAPLAALTFSHSGALLAARDTGGTVQIFKAATGELIHTLVWSNTDATAKVNPVGASAFNADGRLFALGGRDGSIELWEVESGTLRARLRGAATSINALDFSADGRIMASDGDDGVVRLWSVRQ